MLFISYCVEDKIDFCLHVNDFDLYLIRLTRVSLKLVQFKKERKQRRRARAVRERIHCLLNTVGSVPAGRPIPDDSELFAMLPQWMTADSCCHQAWTDWFGVLRRSDVREISSES